MYENIKTPEDFQKLIDERTRALPEASRGRAVVVRVWKRKKTPVSKADKKRFCEVHKYVLGNPFATRTCEYREKIPEHWYGQWPYLKNPKIGQGYYVIWIHYHDGFSFGEDEPDAEIEERLLHRMGVIGDPNLSLVSSTPSGGGACFMGGFCD